MPIITGQDRAGVRRTLDVGGHSYAYYSIPAAEEAGLGAFSRLPASLKVVLENLLRHEDGHRATAEQVRLLLHWSEGPDHDSALDLSPSRTFLHDTNGVPTVVDLAAMREAMSRTTSACLCSSLPELPCEQSTITPCAAAESAGVSARMVLMVLAIDAAS